VLELAVEIALNLYASMTASLNVEGAHVFAYEGTIADLGASIDAVSGSAGLAGSIGIKTFLVFVDSSDPSKVAAVDAVFKTS